MKIARTILGITVVLALFATACASTDSNNSNNSNNANNVNNVNNLNNNTGACSTYCPADKVCVWSTSEHSTCVDPCPCPNDKLCYLGGCVDL